MCWSINSESPLKSPFHKGPDYCRRIYEELANALYAGGVDGFLLESLNCWEEAYFALEGVKAMKMVKYTKLKSIQLKWLNFQ